MTQKKRTDFKILTPPENTGEIHAKTRRIRLQKVRRICSNIVLIFLAVCGTYLMLKNQTYTDVRSAEEYAVNTSDTSSYRQFADGIVRYNRDGVAFLNDENEEQWIQPTQLQNPFIVTNRESFAVADRGGNNILVFSEEGLKGEIETTLPIEKIAISNQGIVSAILKNENSPRIITYDAEGNILVEQQATPGSTGYPIALEMSDDGNTLGVSYVYIEGTSLKSNVIFYNFGEEGKKNTDNVVLSVQYDNTVFGEMFFMGNDRSVAVGDNSFVIYRGLESPEVEREVPVTQEIQSVFHSDDYIGFVVLNEEKSGYEVRLYNRLGDLVLERAIPGKYGSIKIDGDEIIMYDDTKCCIITDTGITKFSGDFKVDVQEIFRAPGLNRYYVMSVDKLRIIYLTK